MNCLSTRVLWGQVDLKRWLERSRESGERTKCPIRLSKLAAGRADELANDDLHRFACKAALENSKLLEDRSLLLAQHLPGVFKNRAQAAMTFRDVAQRCSQEIQGLGDLLDNFATREDAQPDRGPFKPNGMPPTN